MFESGIRRQLESRFTLENELSLAVERNEFELFYQPQVHLADNHLVGAEALIRWRHPVRGLVSPGEFMPVVNTSSISERIANWVLATACRQARQWEEAGHPVRVGINLSPSQLQSGDLAQSVSEMLNATKLSPSLLELEVTENILLIDEQRVRSKSAAELYQKVCDAAVHGGNIRLTAVLIPNLDMALEVVAATSQTGFIPQIDISVDEASIHGHGLAGRAFRSGVPVASNDVLQDESLKPWKDHSIACGVGATLRVKIGNENERPRAKRQPWIWAILPILNGMEHLDRLSAIHGLGIPAPTLNLAHARVAAYEIGRSRTVAKS